MTELVVRRLLIDLNQPFERHWNGGDAFRSALFNALSMSFPAGEQFFIDSVRAAIKRLPAASAAPFDAEVKGFIGQEATHRRIHALFNGQLARQGYVNRWEAAHRRSACAALPAPTRAMQSRSPRPPSTSPRCWPQYLLAHPQALAGAEPRLRDHVAVALRQKSPSTAVRHSTFTARSAATRPGAAAGCAPCHALFHHRPAAPDVAQLCATTARCCAWSTWRSAASFLFGRDGLVRHTFKPWRAYFSPASHPGRQLAASSARSGCETTARNTLR